MKTACILTLCGDFNYGNKLQNYALQEAIKECDFDAKTIWHECYKKDSIVREKTEDKLKLDYENYLAKLDDSYARTELFRSFNNKYLNYYDIKIFADETDVLPKLCADKYVVGSDQIWNNNFFHENFGPFEFAMTVPKEKAFSYAASFGISSIPDDKKDLFKKGLNHLNKISVREKSAVDLVKEVSGREDAEFVVDPTMLLDGDRWSQIIKQPDFVTDGQEYILCYFLGNSYVYDKIKDFAQKHKLSVVNLKENNYEFNHSGPCEFLYLIKNAKMVMTDSFHACVFSILFNTPFYVFDRKDVNRPTNSRIVSLLGSYGLESRQITDFNKVELEGFEVSKDTYELIEEDRKKSMEFLKNSLKG
jgi:hypothetical protein